MKLFLPVLVAVLTWTPIDTTQDFEVYSLGARTFALKTKSGLTNTVGSNSGFIRLTSSVVVIDTHLSVEVEGRAQLEVEKQLGTPIDAVINTHFHADHSSGNPSYPPYVSIWAHENSVDEMRAAQPTRRFESVSKDLLDWRNEDIDVLSIGKAHSVGDVVVYDRRDGVLYTGDVFVNGYIGYLSEAHFTEWITALKKLEGLGAKAIVPGHGPIAATADLVKYRVYLEDFVTSTKEHFDAGGLPKTYVLPEKYQQLGAQFYLEGNVARAYELWKQGLLKP